MRADVIEPETRRGPGETEVAREILRWASRQLLRIDRGRAKFDGSFTPVLEYQGQEWKPLVVYTLGSVEMQLYFLTRSPFDDRAALPAFLRVLDWFCETVRAT
jgi:hypothetical protein